ncbi:MAG: hypothetical protein FJ045_06330, partial [Crenarchaeota archaeon]|nr:hypothetical protein [Thermoproteota archaeon]
MIRIGDELRMWYLGVGDRDDKYRLCYAVSRDGVNWEKPALGLVSYGGNTQNNLVDFSDKEHSVEEAVVIYEPDDPNPDRRFKMVFESENYD